MPAVLFVPFGEVGRLVHVLDDLPPAHASVVGAEGNLAFLSAVRNHAHLSAAEVVIEEILEPHAFDTEHAPHVVRVSSLLGHAIVAIGIGIGRRWFEQIDDLRNRKPSGARSAWKFRMIAMPSCA